MLKGFRTIIINALLAGSVPALQALMEVNWVEMVGPTAAMFVVALINIGMRMITNTPVGKAE